MAVMRCRLGFVGCVLAMAPLLASAEPAPAGKLIEVLQAGQSRLHEFLSTHVNFTRRDRNHPEWLVEQSHDEYDPAELAAGDDLQLVVQTDRRDGADLLTLRQPLLNRGALRAYAGAGINRARYFVDEGDTHELLAKRRRDSSIGAAAELGAELRVSEQLMVSADLRWADFHADTDLLRDDNGPLVAAPMVVGLSVGWRFR